MDIGIHVSLWTPEWESPFLDYIDYAADLGFSCVELPLMSPKKLPLPEIARRISRAGLKVYCGTGLNFETDIGSEDTSVRRRGIDHLEACIRACAEVGADSLGGVIHSPWGMRKIPSDTYTANVSSSLASVADTAEKRGVALALECINRYENSFLNTVSQGLSLVRTIGRENVGLHLDTYHMNIEEKDIPCSILAAGNHISRIHLSENTRGYPGTGSLPWAAIVHAVKESGYKGPWIIESYVDPAFPASSDVCVWRDIESDKGTSLKGSLDFIRRLVGES